MHRTLLLLALLSACTSEQTAKSGATAAAEQSDSAGGEAGGEGAGGDGTDGGAGDGADGDDEPEDPRVALQMAPAAHASTADFLSPEVCADCHSNASGAEAMRTADGTGVGAYDLQHGSVMANAGRDPIFWATLSAEQARAPELSPAIADTCLRCHAPMARWDAVQAGEPLPTPAELRTDTSARASLGREGVSCTTCHRLAPEALALEDAHSGQVEIADNDAIYGPHATPFTDPMEHHTGFTPTEGSHVLDSELCAGCHTLQTHTIVDGAVSDSTFLEQAPYLEWQNSAARDTTSCQDCHLPTTDAAGAPIETAIARNPGGRDFPIDARRPYGQHSMVGGNTFLLAILRDNADVLQPRADAATLTDQIERSREFLASSAELRLTDLRMEGTTLRGTVEVASLVGHKLPTAYPSRRAWLRLRVSDSAGTLRMAIGEVDERGRLVDSAGAPLAAELAGGPVLSHLQQLTGPDEVQVYETIMADAAGQPVYRLLEAAQAVKDNRLLPAGWDPSAAETALGSIAPAGVSDDPDYAGTGGADRLELAVSGLAGEAPFTVEASLLYQPYAPRHAAELLAADTPEVRALEAMLDEADWTPETLATTTATAD